jgi:hypothetical protein
MVVTGSEHPGVIRYIYFELVHTVRLDNGMITRMSVEFIEVITYASRATGLFALKARSLCPECRTAV